MNYQIEYTSAATVISLTVKDLGPRSARLGMDRLLRNVADPSPIVIDLGELVTLGPAGIGLLARWISEARARRLQLVVVSKSMAVLAILELVRIQALVPVFRSCGEALASLAPADSTQTVAETHMAIAVAAS